MKLHQNLPRITDTFHEDQYIYMNTSRSIIPRKKNFSDKKITENGNTHFISSNFFFSRKLFLLRYNVEKYCTAGQTTDDNMAHAHCMLDT